MTIEYEKLVVLMEASISKFDKDITAIGKSVDTAMRKVEDSTSSATSTVERNMNLLASKLVGIRGAFGPLAAAATAFGAIRFGENIAENFDKIAEKAREYGIEIDQSIIQKMKDAEVASARAWTSIQVAAAPAIASIGTGLANIVSNLAGMPGDLDRLTNSLRAAQAVAERSAGTSAGRAAAARVTDIQGQISRLQEPANIAITNQNANATEAMRQQILKEKSGDLGNQQLFGLQQGTENLGINNLNFTGTADLREKVVNEHRADNEAILQSDQDLAAQQLQIENENFAATEDMRQKIMRERLDDADAVARFQDEQGRRIRQLDEEMRRGIIASFSDFGSIMEQAGGKFGKAVESMLLDLAKLALRLETTKALTAAFGDSSSGGGPDIFGSLLGGAAKFLGLSGFAGGGDPPVGVPSMVGEKGPEWFVPKVPGTIYPHGTAPGGGGRGDINIHVYGPSGDGHIRAMVAAGVQQGLSQYDRQALPTRVMKIIRDPSAR